MNADDIDSHRLVTQFPGWPTLPTACCSTTTTKLHLLHISTNKMSNRETTLTTDIESQWLLGPEMNHTTGHPPTHHFVPNYLVPLSQLSQRLQRWGLVDVTGDMVEAVCGPWTGRDRTNQDRHIASLTNTPTLLHSPIFPHSHSHQLLLPLPIVSELGLNQCNVLALHSRVIRLQ